MATISQLMEGKVPGSIKVRKLGWVNTYFVPYFRAGSFWHGTCGLACTSEQYVLSDDWVLWEEPKPNKRKTAVYQWAVRVKDGDIYTPDYYYESEEKLLKDHTWALWYQRLDYTKIEVEVDE